jgi:hypothetical protein
MTLAAIRFDPGIFPWPLSPMEKGARLLSAFLLPTPQDTSVNRMALSLLAQKFIKKILLIVLKLRLLKIS